MANKIHAIKFLNWLFLRIKPSDYDPTQPLEFEGGIGGGASLPEQTGNAGKFLQTDGTNVSWGEALTNKVRGNAGSNLAVTPYTETLWVGSNSIAIGGKAGATGGYATSVGFGAQSTSDYGLALGYLAEVPGYTKYNSIALGAFSKVNAKGSIHICTSEKNYTQKVYGEENSFGWTNNNGTFTLFDADGNVPLERLTYVTTNISQMGDQVQGIEERIPGHITTDNPVAAISDAGKRLKNPTDTDASFCLQFGDLVMCGGTVAFNNLGAGIAAEMPADLPVAMAGDYIVVCTPTADSNFDHLIADYGSRTSNAFTISCDNMGDAQATNVKVSWIAIGKKGA